MERDHGLVGMRPWLIEKRMLLAYVRVPKAPPDGAAANTGVNNTDGVTSIACQGTAHPVHKSWQIHCPRGARNLLGIA